MYLCMDTLTVNNLFSNNYINKKNMAYLWNCLQWMTLSISERKKSKYKKITLNGREVELNKVVFKNGLFASICSSFL